MTEIPQKPGFYHLGDNLYARIRSPSAQQFVYRYSRDGKRHDLILGRIGDITIAEARTRLADYKSLLGRGIDPLEHRHAHSTLKPARTRRSSSARAPIEAAPPIEAHLELGRLAARIDLIERSLNELGFKVKRIEDLAREQRSLRTLVAKLESSVALILRLNSEDSAVAARSIHDLGALPAAAFFRGYGNRDEAAQVERYFKAAVAAGELPTQQECSRQTGLPYIRIRRHWPRGYDSRRELLRRARRSHVTQ